MAEIQLRGEILDNDTADIARWWGWRDITAPMDIQAALEAAGGEDVTILVNSPGGDLFSGAEIRSMLRRYPGRTEALIQGYAASAATVAITACTVIRCESGALCCYHNPASTAEGDYRDMAGASKSLENARDSIIEAYMGRPGFSGTKEELIALMDQDIFITPDQAKEYGLIDEVIGATEHAVSEGTGFTASAGRRLRLTDAMREAYRAHVAQDKKEAARALAKIRALAAY